MLRKVSIKISLFLLIVAGLNYLYNVTLFKERFNEKCKEIVELREKQKDADMFYFGESSNITFLPDDSIKNSISEMTNLFYPGLAIVNINKYATHGGIYKYWLGQINLKSNKPKAIIITLNLRSFNAAWVHSKLETPLQEELVLIRPFPNILNRFSLSLQAFDNKSESEREKDMLKDWQTTHLKFPFAFKYRTVSEWDKAVGAGSYLKADGSWDMDKITLACHYIKGYAFNLNESNQRIKDFDCIADWCYKNKIKLYLNLMAENCHYADSLVGKELVFLMRENRDYLVQRYSKQNCIVVDNLEEVEGIDFIDQKWTTEHYNYKGRMKVAKNLAAALKKQFINEYKPAY